MSARQLREAIKVHRQTKRELTYLSKKCLQNIGGRLQPGARVGFVHMPGAASGAAAEQQRGAGGALPPFPNFEPISDQQLKRFKLDRLHNGVLVVLKQRGEPPAATWHYVVPAEDLDSFLLSLSLAGLGINRAFDKARNQFKVRLSDNPDGTPRWTGDGAEGIGKDGVKAWMKLDIVAADRRPVPPAAQPQTQPFMVNRVNEHWQADVRGDELELAVPERAAQLNFDGVETAGVPEVSMTALARGLAKGCSCRKQCGAKCPCKKRNSPCSRGCGCKCKVGANCGNH